MRLTITKQIGFLFLLPACGALAALGVFYTFFVQTVHDRPFINVASRQRTLSEQLGAYAYMVSIGQEEDRAPLRGFITAFEQSLGALERGGQHADHTLPPAPPETQDEIAGVKRLWEAVRQSLLLVADRPADDPEARASYTLVASAIPRLTEASNRVVIAFEARGRVQWERMFSILLGIAGLNLFLIPAGVWIIRRYTAERRRMEEAQREAERTRVLIETAGAAAHEINQPLTAVIGFTQLLLMDAAPDDPLRRDLEMIHEAGQKIREIVSKMQNIQEYATRPYAGDARIVDFGAASAQNPPTLKDDER